MKRSIQKRKRIFLLFFLGIGIPSVLLGYLAFRGIQNDQALIEKTKRNEYQKLVGVITKSVDEKFHEVEQAFDAVISNRNDLLQPIQSKLFADFKHKYPLVEEVFLFQNFNKIHFPAAKLLFFTNGSIQTSSAQFRLSSISRLIKEGQQQEFQLKNYSRALSNYQQAFEKTSINQIKGELLNAIARVQKKSSHIEAAISSYKTIIRDFSQVRLSTGIPLGLGARMELGSLILAKKDFLDAARTFIESFGAMINREWRLERAQYSFFVKNIKKSINDILSQASLPEEALSYENDFQKLEDEERKKKETTEKLLAFQESAGINLQAKISQSLDEAQDTTERFILTNRNHVYLVSLMSLSSKSDNQADKTWGLIFNPDYLKSTVLKQALEHNIPTEKTGWILRGRDGRELLSTKQVPGESPAIKTNFIGNFPDWTIELYPQGIHLFETFLTSRRGIYFYSFLLIGSILVFGLILTLKTVTHEIGLARMKSDFVSTISHEFKSPLTSIRQLSEMLQTGRVPSEERRKKYYDVLVEQSERLTLLTDNVLNLAKMDEGRREFEFKRTDIYPLLKELVSGIQDRVRHDGFKIQIKMEKPLPILKLDSEAMTQVVTNLIDNAIKYSGERKKIIVRVYTENRDLIISVQDFGVGIRKEELDKVFERFYRVGEELTRRVKGSGLGLTLVKQIVEAHQGTVEVESEPGLGSIFSLRIPIRE